MKIIDAVGYLAAVLMLATFCMRSMGSPSVVALTSNLAFITYDYLGNLTPVLVLHALLLPVNACRARKLPNCSDVVRRQNRKKAKKINWLGEEDSNLH